jgi:hypothetical protein
MNIEDVKKMTPWEKTVAIARICGKQLEPLPLWSYEAIGCRGNNFRFEADARAAAEGWKRNPEDVIRVYQSGGEWMDPIPDYLNDLNACHEMERNLPDRDHLDRYKGALQRLIVQSDKDDYWEPVQTPDTCVWHASAEFRSISFLATMLP